MSRTYSVKVELSLDKPLEEFDGDLEKYIEVTIMKGIAGNDLIDGIIEVKVSQLKDRQEARSHGGHARAEALSPRQRTKIARQAANARWAKQKEKKEE